MAPLNLTSIDTCTIVIKLRFKKLSKKTKGASGYSARNSSISGGGVSPMVGKRPFRTTNSFISNSAFIWRRLFSTVSSWRRWRDSFCFCFALSRLFLTARLLRSLRLWYSSLVLNGCRTFPPTANPGAQIICGRFSTAYSTKLEANSSESLPSPRP